MCSSDKLIILHVLADLTKQIASIQKILEKEKTLAKETRLNPSQIPEWLTLSEARILKGGCSLSTLRHRPFLQPNGGVAEGRIGGVKVWRRQTILEWSKIPDANMEAYLHRTAKENLKKGDIGPSYVHSS